ncbi:hypothetical protein SAMN04487912_101231 [Arthrobacter sp. cf158]|uniref:hypothetical protein n=1 Tax=Arthrobacter sp. cf158 TaxID=1761744 RepID=UPI00089D0ACD|nr:hypothetical protein [Arthrobacter sp. cf158]SDW04139.1 hypothetical protein SAMN04487912_101231 [Arthrobacter sp. cf158]
MDSNEYRADETITGPLQLKSIWQNHDQRNFDLMVILQISGCEHAAQSFIRNEQISALERQSLNIANEIAAQKGYLPLFDLTEQNAGITDNGAATLQDFFHSAEWETRDPRGTRKL